MHWFVFIFLQLTIISHGLAQTDSIPIKSEKIKYGGRSGFYFTGYQNGFNYYGLATLTMNIHEFSVGPSFGKSPHFYDFYNLENDGARKFNGVDFCYRILPNGKGKVFDFYFQLNYFQKWGKGIANELTWDFSNPNEYVYDNVRLKSNASQLLLEYGFDIKFLNHFYVGNSIGIGGILEFSKFTYETYSQFSYKETQHNLDFIYRTSVGFRF